MQIKSLEHTLLKELTQVFNLAFSDYTIKVTRTEEATKARFIRSRVDLRQSVGVYDGNQLIAFIFAGTGLWNGKPTVYNAGTGVIPSRRGNKLVRKMYDFAIPLWKKSGFRQTSLEVLVDNEIAIKAYQSVGMKISHRLISLQGQLTQKITPTGFLLNPKSQPNWADYLLLNTSTSSWDFNKSGVEAVAECYKTYELRDVSNNLLGFAIINDENQIAQAGVSVSENWISLFTALGQYYNRLKWINIHEDQTVLINLLKKINWKILVQQYEMSGEL